MSTAMEQQEPRGMFDSFLWHSRGFSRSQFDKLPREAQQEIMVSYIMGLKLERAESREIDPHRVDSAEYVSDAFDGTLARRKASQGQTQEDGGIFHPLQWLVFAVFVLVVATAMVWVPALVGRP